MEAALKNTLLSLLLAFLTTQWVSAAPMATYVPPPDLSAGELSKLGSSCIGADPQKGNVLKLIAQLESGEKNFKSVDQFLEALPPQMRRDFVMMTESRSFQESSAKDPRVLLKSPNSELIVSFNSDPKHRGYQHIEVMFWNEKNQNFQFIDLQFPADQAKVPGGGGPPLTKAQVTRNPESCLKCHGNSPRPQWDPYNFWSGQTPFNRDTLTGGSPENEIYANILRRIKNGEDRFRHLQPKDPIDQTLENIKNNQTMQLTTDNYDGPGVEMFDQLTPLNRCRVANELKSYPQLKPFSATIQSLKKCTTPVAELLPQWAKDQARDYFEGRGIKNPSTGEFDYKALQEETSNRQISVFNDKLARQRLFFEKYFGSAEKAEKAMTARETENREASLDSITRLRYLLEPLGIPVNSWSMSLDPETYTFADLFSASETLVHVGEASNTLNCEQLKAKSLADLANANPTRYLAAEADNCVRKIAEEKAVTLVASTAKDVLRTKMLALLEKYKCAACHVDDEYFMGAPTLPFRSGEKLDEMMHKNRGGGLANWDSIMWSRIMRGESAPGRMPAMGPPIRDPEDLAVIKAYLESAKP